MSMSSIFKVLHKLSIDLDDCISVYFSDYLLLKLIFFISLNWGKTQVSCILKLKSTIATHWDIIEYFV